jgi:hypothetical protein
MSFLPPLRDRKVIRQTAKFFCVGLVFYCAAMVSEHLIWHKELDWVGIVIWTLFSAAVCIFDLDGYYGWRSSKGQPPSITPDRDEAHRA